jgi:hypothetical protein
VATALSEPTDDGTECSLSPGTILTRIDDTPDADQNVKVLVSASQKGDCHSGSQVAVAVQDLQEMHNDFHQKIDDGLGKLADNQGKNGMPKGPSAQRRAVPEGTAEPDLTASADLAKQQQDADAAEKEVSTAAADKEQGDD